MRGLTPAPELRRIGQFQPIPLGFLTRGMWDHRIRALGGGAARLTHRTQVPGADIAGQALIRQAEPKLLELVEQSAGPQVRVLGQPGAEVVDERIERIRTGACPDPRFAVTGQILADRLAVEAGMAGDR
jgi:hypothetical protein